jgi:hypothetical protein
LPHTLRHILIVADESRIASFNWARVRREAAERDALISLISCHGVSADLVVPVQPAVDAPRALQLRASSRTASAGVGAAVVDRVVQAQVMVASIELTEIRVLGSDTLRSEVWDLAHGTSEVTLERYDLTGSRVSALTAPRTKAPTAAPPAATSATAGPSATGCAGGRAPQIAPTNTSKIPLPVTGATQAAQSTAPTSQQLDAAHRRAITAHLNRLEARWKFTEVLWILFWVAAVIGIDSSIISAFADPYAANPDDPATRIGYNFITCVLVDCGILIPALICRAAVYALRAQTRTRLRKEL